MRCEKRFLLHADREAQRVHRMHDHLETEIMYKISTFLVPKYLNAAVQMVCACAVSADCMAGATV